ncbi:hypothetical protein, partial [Pseudomonas kilonensis]|uniref:hypothetical protein n=1 Tax=Pseudomonas kilonensis TaxID=132476 RepID=UPI001C8F745E
ECNEAAIFPLALESQVKDQDQKIAAFGSSYRAVPSHNKARHIDVLTILCQGYFLRLTVKPPNAEPDSLHPAHP